MKPISFPSRILGLKANRPERGLQSAAAHEKFKCPSRKATPECISRALRTEVRAPSVVTCSLKSHLSFSHLALHWKLASGIWSFLILISALTFSLPALSQPVTFNTLAGYPGGGSADAAGSGAQFSKPTGIAVDTSGNIYVADTFNHTIRKITPTGIVTTVAGAAGVSGATDASGPAARFNQPGGIAVDAAGYLYVGDTANHTIRKITPAGTVSTLAGSAGISGSANATGTNAQFNLPQGVAVDSSGNVYVADYGNYTIRMITPAGAVSTLAGLAGNPGSIDDVGSNARFYQPEGVAVDAAGFVYVADTANGTIRRISP